MVYLFLKHTVMNFDQWKTVYDAMNAAHDRRCVGSRVLWSLEDPNQVMVLEEYHSLKAAQAWAQSSELRVAMGHAGVRCAPEIAYLEHVP